MLHQIVLSSLVLVMTTCATFIPTKVNAGLLVFTEDSLEKDQGQSITFKVSFDPMLSDPGDFVIFHSVMAIRDASELSYNSFGSEMVPQGTPIYGSTTVAEFKFDVLPPKPQKDGSSDILSVTLTYFLRLGNVQLPLVIIDTPLFDVIPVPEQNTPEPLTMLGAATALGYGVILKRESLKKKKS